MTDDTDLDGTVDEAEWFDAITRIVGDGVYQLDPQGRFVRVNWTVLEVTGYARAELLGESPAKILTEESLRRTVRAVEQLLESDDDVAVVEMTIVTADGEEIPVENRLATVESDGEFRGTVGIVRDVSDRKRRERQLETQRDELARLDRINVVIRETIRTLVDASSREEITEPVCERLAASNAYCAAWIGHHGSGGGAVVPIAAAGVDPAVLERTAQATDDWATGADPPSAPFRTGRIEVADVPAADPVRAALGAEGELAVAAVPLVYGETVYGVLYVYTERTGGFGEAEIEVLEELGETIGLAMNAIETKRLLYADTVTELEFEFDDPDRFAAALTEGTRLTVEFESVVPGSEGEWLAYASVTGGDPEGVLERAREHPAVADASVVRAGEEDELLLLTVTGRTPITTIREAGGRIERAVVDDGVSRIVCEVAAGADTRQVVEQFQQSFPEASLVAQREAERSVEPPGEVRRGVLDSLTEKQQQALEVAFFGQYFQRPRPTTGAELADSLGVTPSTFHQHLQAGLRKVLRAVFDPPEGG
jgi:PAS domain S-box-containing protein